MCIMHCVAGAMNNYKLLGGPQYLLFYIGLFMLLSDDSLWMHTSRFTLYFQLFNVFVLILIRLGGLLGGAWGSSRKHWGAI